MKIETVAISSLTPDPKNARVHETGVPELAASLDVIVKRWEDFTGKKATRTR